MKRPMIITSRLIGRRLRRQREVSGFSLNNVEQMKGVPKATLSRIENGKARISQMEAEGLTRLYMRGRDDAEALERETGEMVRNLGRGGWWEGHLRYLMTDINLLLEFEVVSEVMTYEAELVPGLLQTDAYAHRIGAVTPIVPEERKTRAMDAKRSRRQSFWVPGRPPASFIIHESALCRPIGDATGQAEQRDRLIEMSDQADIRVLPTNVGAHPSMVGSYTILIPQDQDFGPPTVYMESAAGCRYEDADAFVKSHVAVWHATYALTVPVKEYFHVAQVEPEQ